MCGFGAPDFTGKDSLQNLLRSMEALHAVVGMKRIHECVERADLTSSLPVGKLQKFESRFEAKEIQDSDESLTSNQDKSTDGNEQCRAEKVLPHKAFLKVACNSSPAAASENMEDQKAAEGWEIPTEFCCLEEDHISGLVECNCITPPLSGPVFAGHNTQPHQKFRKLVLAQKEWKSVEARQRLGEIGKKKAKVLGANDLRHIALVFGYKSKHFKRSPHQAETPLPDGIFSVVVKEKAAENFGSQTEATKANSNNVISTAMESLSENTETNCAVYDSSQRQTKGMSPQTKLSEEKTEDEGDKEKLRKIAEQVGTDLLEFAKGKAANSNILEILSGFSKASESEHGAKGNGDLESVSNTRQDQSGNVSGFKPWSNGTKTSETSYQRVSLSTSQFCGSSKESPKPNMAIPSDFWNTLHKSQISVNSPVSQPFASLPTQNSWISPQSAPNHLWNLQSAAQKLIEAQSLSALDFSTLSSLSMASQMQLPSPSSGFTGHWMGNRYRQQERCYTNGCSISSTDLQSS